MPIKPRRLHTGNKVKIIKRASSHFERTGTLKEPRSVPVGMKLEYYWLVELDGVGATELFAPEDLEIIE